MLVLTSVRLGVLGDLSGVRLPAVFQIVMPAFAVGPNTGPDMPALDFDTVEFQPAALRAGSATPADIDNDWLDLGSEFIDAQHDRQALAGGAHRPESRPGRSALAYEELALGNLGRFADEMAVVRCTPGHEPVILRAGPRFEAVVGSACASTPISGLFHAFSFAIRAARSTAPASGAIRTSRSPRRWSTAWSPPSRPSPSRCPAAGRANIFSCSLRPRASRLDLAHMLINSAQQGIMALSPVEDAERGSTFYILGINLGAASYFGAHPA